MNVRLRKKLEVHEASFQWVDYRRKYAHMVMMDERGKAIQQG